MKKIASLLVLAGICLIPLTSSGQEVIRYPVKPITFIIPFGAGGGADITCRTLCKIAEGILGQPIVAENKPGGAGAIGINLIAKAKPDGYTIGAFTYSSTIIGPHLRDIPFKAKEDFSFIGQCAEYAHALVVKPDAPWKTFNDFIEDARKNPGKRTYCTQGAKSANHIRFALIAQKANVQLRHIPYASDTEELAAVLGGHVDTGIISGIASHIKSGTVRALAIADSLERWKILQDVPTLAEIGYRVLDPTWIGVVGPKGMPKEILKKLENAFEKAAKDPSFHEAIDRVQLVPLYRSGEEFKEVVLKDYNTVGEILKKLSLD